MTPPNECTRLEVTGFVEKLLPRPFQYRLVRAPLYTFHLFLGYPDRHVKGLRRRRFVRRQNLLLLAWNSNRRSHRFR